MANETILVVDADTKSQKVLEVSFKKAGYRVTLTDSPLQAKRLIVAEQPDLIISDTTFADGDGFAFLASLKEAETTRWIPFIFLTEDRSLPQKMRGFELGADDYLTKPVYIKEVTTRVELLLQKRTKDMLSEASVEELDGDLADITMIDLLQLIEEEHRSGSIRLTRAGREAAVYFRDGNILDAICGKLQGEEAIYRLLLWPDGKFHLQYHDHVNRPDRVPKDSSELLLEGIRRLEVWNDLVGKLPAFATVFEADYSRLPNLDLLPEPVARIARLFDGVRSLRDVLDDSPLDDVTTLQIAHKLHVDGALKNIDTRPQEAPKERTNLAAWLDGRHARERENTAPKFGAASRSERPTARLEMAETAPLPRPDVEPIAPQMVGQTPAAADARSSWKFHFEGETPANSTEHIRKIEEEERKRREAEAQVLTGQHRAITQHMIKSVSRTPDVEPPPADPSADGGFSRFFADVKAAEQAHVPDSVDPMKATDVGFGGPTPDERGDRVTHRLIPTVSRTTDPGLEHRPKTTPHAVPAAETESSPTPETESRRRQRLSTPISTPVQTTRLVDQRFDEDDDEPEVQEASTKELPTVDQVSAVREEILAARVVSESETVLDQASSLADARHADVNTDETWNRLSDELSEADAFEDDEPEDSTADPEDSAERITRDLRPLSSSDAGAADVTPPATASASGDITPFPGELPSDASDEVELEEIDDVQPVPPLVERLAKDGEMVTATFNLSRGPRKPSSTSELETVELPEREKAGAAAAALESTQDLPREDVAAKAKADAEAKAKQEADDQAKADAEAKAKQEADDKAKADAEAKAKQEADDQAKADAEAKAKQEADDKAKAKQEADDQAKADAEAKAKQEADDQAKADAEAKAKQEADDQAKGPSKSADDSHETAFFSSDVSADEYLPTDEPQGNTAKFGIAVFVVIIAALIALVVKNGKDEDPALTVVQNTPTQTATSVVEVKPEPTPTAAQVTAAQTTGADLEVAATALGQNVGQTATDSANVFAGVVTFDAGTTADAGSDAAVDAGMAVAQVEPTQATEPTTQTATQVKEPKTQPATEVKEPKITPPAATTVEGRIAAAEKLVKRENFGGALEDLRKLSTEEPTNGKVAFLHGQAAFGALRNGEAIEQYQRAERLGFRPAGLYLDLGAAYQLEGNKDKAKAAYQKFLELRPSGRDADEVRTILQTRFN